MPVERIGPGDGVLVTGANGFVGSKLVTVILERGWFCRALVRARSNSLPHSVEQVVAGDFSSGSTEIAEACSGVHSVIHLAGRAHKKGENDARAAYTRDNVAVTRSLAAACAANGVRRFVYVSSIKVYGDGSRQVAIDENTPPDPTDAYGETKLLAEAAAQEAVRTSRTEVLIFRPPLIYGPGVKANFLKLMSLVHRGVPLPFKGVRNLRSLIYVRNFADVLAHSLGVAARTGDVYLVSDGSPLSTQAIVQRLSVALNVDSRLFFMPPAILKAAWHLPGLGKSMERLLGSLYVDTRSSERALQWSPPFSQDQAFHDTAQWYMQRQQ